MKGSYLLVLKLNKDKEVQIGKLGKIFFKKGFYCYVGSAMGKAMNIENRTGRHKRLNKKKQGKLKWHVDYLLIEKDVEISELKVFESDEKIECELAKEVLEKSDGSVKNFGSSDCKCGSHLYYFEDKMTI